MRGRDLLVMAAVGFLGSCCRGDTCVVPRGAAAGTTIARPLTVWTPDLAVDARVLVIARDASSPGLAAVRRALAFQATPHDELLVASAAPITGDTLAAGTHGKYQGILLADDQVPLAAAEEDAIAAYQTTFNVRRAILSGSPTAEYGLAPGPAAPAGASGSWTAEAAEVFGDIALERPLGLSGLALRPGTVSDGSTCRPMLKVGDGVIAALHTAADGRETLVLTFDQSPWTMTTKQLMPSVISWVTHGLFLGERRVYFGAQLDDLFRKTPLYGSDTEFRLGPADLDGLLAWLARLHQSSVTAEVTVSFAANPFWAGTDGSDPLTEALKQASGKLQLINHTWDHVNLNGLSYADARSEIASSDAALLQLGFQPYSTKNLITPEVSGLKDANVMRAMADAGVRYLVTDTSRPGEDNPTPNVGLWNPLQPAVFMIPRRPTELYYNVSTPAEWEAEYAFIHPTTGPARTAAQIIDSESDVLAAHLVEGEMDPWMFHQANARAYAADHSLIADLLGATLDKYARLLTVPVSSPTMDVLGQRMAERTELAGAGVSAVIGPGAQVTLNATGRAVVPITGLVCAATGEIYNGRLIVRVPVEAGQQVVVPFDDGSCKPGADASTPGDAASETGPQTLPVDATGEAALPPVHHGGGGCSTSGAAIPPATAGALLLVAALVVLRRFRSR